MPDTAPPDDDSMATLGAAPSQSDRAPALPATQASVQGFELLKELGRGAMGVVYLARQEGLSRLVALKMVLQGQHAGLEELARFRREGEAIARLDHPNIVRVFAVGDCAGLPYLAMEHVDGGSLADLLAAGPLPPPAAAAIAAAVARGVHAAHQAGIVHRDLKPGNVLLAQAAEPAPVPTVEAKVADFGLAKRLDAGQGATQTGAILGTPAYMAPEQARGQSKDIGPAADVYSVGAILYECLAGRPPFAGTTAFDTLQQVLAQDPAPPRAHRPGLPADLEAVALKCLEKDPARRYASAADLADDLDRYRRGEPVRASRRWRLLQQAYRHPRKLAALAVLPLLWVALADARFVVPGGNAVRRWMDGRELSLFRPAPTREAVCREAARLRGRIVSHLLDKTPTRDGWVSLTAKDKWSPPDAWGQAQSTAALLLVPEAGTERLAPHLDVLAEGVWKGKSVCRPFVPGFGWPRYSDGYPSSEGAAWALWAMAAALNRIGEQHPARPALLARLGQLQETLARCRTSGEQGAGGWNLFARQEDPSVPCAYIGVVACHGLLEMHKGGLPWRGSRDEARRVLDETLGWLTRAFDGQGWKSPMQDIPEALNDGLTLQAFSALLKAEAAGAIDLPEEMLERIGEHLEGCGTRALDHPLAVALYQVPFRSPAGEEVTTAQRPIRMLWHPWAIDCAARWLDRAERVGAPPEERVARRRVLGHLVLALGDPAAGKALSGFTFLVAELLLGLGALAEEG